MISSCAENGPLPDVEGAGNLGVPKTSSIKPIGTSVVSSKRSSPCSTCDSHSWLWALPMVYPLGLLCSALAFGGCLLRLRK